MQKIGFSLYTEMLEQAVAAIKSGRRPDLDMDSGQVYRCQSAHPCADTRKLFAGRSCPANHVQENIRLY